MIYGYARVSTVHQETDLQMNALRRSGVRRNLIFQEKTSSVGSRPELHRLMSTVSPGDVIVVYKLDRLARSLKDLLTIIERLEAAGAGFKSITEPIDTSTPAGRLMIQVLGAVAEFERSLIRERSVAGQVAAIKRGARIGRPRILTPEQEREVLAMWQSGEWRKVDLCRYFNVKDTTIRRVIYASERPDHPWIQPNRPIIGPLLKC